MNRVFAAIGRGSVRFRWPIIILWVVVTVFAVRSLPSLASQVNNNNQDFLPASAPSVQAADLAKPLVGGTNQGVVPVVVTSASGAFDAADREALARLTTELKVPTVESVHFLAGKPQAVQLLVTSSTNAFDQTKDKTLVDDLTAAIGRADLPPGLEAHLSGQLATDVANQEKSSKQGNQIQSASLLFIILLLLIIFRSVLAPLVTLLPAVFSLALAGSFIGGLGAHGLKISFFTQILLIVLLLGAGTDYGLFLVFRVREEIENGRGHREAVAVAVAKVGESITASAGTVIIALLTLTLASFGIYHDLGIPLAIGIAVMLLAGLTLLPALLAVLGRAVFWPSKLAPRQHHEGLWGRVAGRLVQRPVLTLAVGVVAFGVLAVFVFAYKPGGFGGETTAPAGTGVAAGNAAVAKYFPRSSNNPTNVIMSFPRSAWDDPAQLEAVTRGLEASGAFTTVAGPLEAGGQPLTAAELTHLHDTLPPARTLVDEGRLTAPAGLSQTEYDAYLATARYLSPDGTTAQWEVGLAAGDPNSTAALNAIPHVRDEVTAVARSVGATASGVAGEAPALYDVSNISGGDLRHIIPIAVLAIGIVLALVLRSLIAPLYLIASVVLSYLASLGLAVIVFIKIGGDGGIVFLLPFLMFIFLLALGEDYNILVMTRIREEAARSPLKQAVVRAVGVTGPTVTSAGLVLAGSFAVLAIVGGSGNGNGQVREIGFGLAVGILLDTFVVRTVLVPATVILLGRWNWWPSAMGRHVEPDALEGGGGGDGGGGGGSPDGSGPVPDGGEAAPVLAGSGERT